MKSSMEQEIRIAHYLIVQEKGSMRDRLREHCSRKQTWLWNSVIVSGLSIELEVRLTAWSKYLLSHLGDVRRLDSGL